MRVVLALLLSSAAILLAACGTMTADREPSTLPAGQAAPAQVPNTTSDVRETRSAATAGEILVRGGSHRSVSARVHRDPGASGCNKAMPQGLKAGGTTVRQLTSGGLKRSYRLHIPPSATMTTKIPLVLNFHGRTGTAADQEAYSGLLPVSDRETFLLVSPEGTGTPTGWSAGATPANSVDDIKFINDLLDTLQKELCVDGGRVYAAGFSNGAFMASRAACELPDRITATAAGGGPASPQRGGGVPVPVIAFHGTADEVVPINGGLVRAWQYAGAYDAFKRWAQNNDCIEPSDGVGIGGDAVRLAGGDCLAPTELVVVNGAGHVWPGSPALPKQIATPVAAPELIWAFLSRQRIES